MQTQVEIRYAGVVVAKASEARATEDGGLFLTVPEPLPVGTLVAVGPDSAAARVERVVESSDPATAGMLVRATAGARIAEVATSAEPLSPAVAAALAAPVGTVASSGSAPVPAPVVLSESQPVVVSVAFAEPAPRVLAADPPAPPAVVAVAAPPQVAAAESPVDREPGAPVETIAESSGELSGEASGPVTDLPPAKALSGGGRKRSGRRRK